MKKIELIMGMPVKVAIINGNNRAFKKVFDYFKYVDEKFSTYKENSEISLINKRELKIENASSDMKLIFKLSEKLKQKTNGYFDINNNGHIDPSGIVKGWAIYNASKILDKMGFKNYYVNAGGDIQTKGLNSKGEKWKVGIRNPFNLKENVKIVYLSGEGIATSGTYERGNHIYNPKKVFTDEIVSITVIGKNVYEADKFSTPAFVMGKDGINFIDSLKGLEGYMITKDGIATMTRGFEKYTNA